MFCFDSINLGEQSVASRTNLQISEDMELAYNDAMTGAGGWWCEKGNTNKQVYCYTDDTQNNENR